MAYYLRVLSTSDKGIPLKYLKDALSNEKLKATITHELESDLDWTHLILSHEDNTAIASIERNCVYSGSLGEAELEEFYEDLPQSEPTSAATWLQSYFKSVRCIYVFQVLSGTDYKNGWDILDCVKNAIWRLYPSIIQADYEGFTNEDGYHILWQFSDSAKAHADWCMGVLKDGRWIHFKMNLNSQEQKKAFLKGEIPDGVQML